MSEHPSEHILFYQGKFLLYLATWSLWSSWISPPLIYVCQNEVQGLHSFLETWLLGIELRTTGKAVSAFNL